MKSSTVTKLCLFEVESYSICSFMAGFYSQFLNMSLLQILLILYLFSGDFLFLTKSWPIDVINIQRSPKFSSLVINCTTNFENASVWLEAISRGSNGWTTFSASKGESLEKIGQIFIINKVQETGRFFSCKGKWMDKTICLYKGLLVIGMSVNVTHYYES